MKSSHLIITNNMELLSGPILLSPIHGVKFLSNFYPTYVEFISGPILLSAPYTN